MGIKTGDLKETLRFLVDVCGMHIMGHSEMDSGCKLDCNGPFPNAWSKTMIGYGEECEGYSNLEVAYNYGIKKYEHGSDLLEFELAEVDIPTRAIHRGYKVEKDEIGSFLTGPNGFKWRLRSGYEKYRLIGLSLASINPVASAENYSKIFGLDASASTTSVTELTGADPKNMTLKFVAAKEIVHKETFCRLALGVADPAKLEEQIEKGLIRFSTTKLDGVTLCVILDGDGYEVALANLKDYKEARKPKHKDSVIDWAVRFTKEQAANTKTVADEVTA